MILGISGFPEELHRKLRMAAAIECVTIQSIVIEAIEKRLSGVVVPAAIVGPIAEPSVPVTEHTSSIGRSEEVAVPKKRKEAEWVHGMCPKHGRMAINGKFTCC